VVHGERRYTYRQRDKEWSGRDKSIN